MKIILINGAPRSGKDTISAMLKQIFPTDVLEEKFARPIKLTVPMLFGIPHDEFKKHYDSARHKDSAAPAFFGKTPRQVQIALSETFLKPLFGEGIFGRLLVSRIVRTQSKSSRCVVVSDSGFRAEAEELVKEFGADNIFLWRLHRDGCDYSSDSRGHISLADLGVIELDIDNNGELEDLVGIAEGLYTLCTLPRFSEEDQATYRQRIKSILKDMSRKFHAIRYNESATS